MDPSQQRAEQLLAAGLNDFEAFINQMENEMNVEREEDEYVFSLCKQTNPNTLPLKLRDLLLSENSNICSISAYLLRSHFLEDALMWNRLEEANRSAIIRTFKDEVHYQEDEKVRTSFCRAISAAISMTRSSHLLETTIRWMTRSDHRAQEIGTLILGCIEPPYENLLSAVRNLYHTFSTYLNEGPLSVKVYVIKASCRFLPHMRGDHEFRNLLPLMVRAVRGMIRDGEEETAITLLDDLRLMVSYEPRCVKGNLKVLPALLEISSEDTVRRDIRSLSLRFVLVFLRRVNETAVEMMSDLKSYIEMLLHHLMDMLKDFEEIGDWLHEGEEEHVNAWQLFSDSLNDHSWVYTEETDAFSLSKVYLHELVLVLDRQANFPIVPQSLQEELSEIVFQLLSTYLLGGGGNNWQSIHGGIIAFSILGGRVVTNDRFDLLVNTLVRALRENLTVEPYGQHPVVTWAGISTFMKLYRDGDHDRRHLIANETVEFLTTCKNLPNL